MEAQLDLIIGGSVLLDHALPQGVQVYPKASKYTLTLSPLDLLTQDGRCGQRSVSSGSLHCISSGAMLSEYTPSLLKDSSTREKQFLLRFICPQRGESVSG